MKVDNLRKAWTQFLTGLLLRCPQDLAYFRESWRDYVVEVPPEWERLYAATRKPGEAPTLTELLVQMSEEKEEDSMFQAYLSLFEHRNVLGFIKKMIWGVIDVSNCTHKLLTSDRPVIRTNALKRVGGHIAMPITPTKLFVAAADYPTMNSIKDMSRNEIVRNCNQQVVEGAQKYVYASDRTQSGFIQARLGNVPQPRLVYGFFKKKRIVKVVDSGADAPRTGGKVSLKSSAATQPSSTADQASITSTSTPDEAA